MKRIFVDADLIISAFDSHPTEGRTQEQIAQAKALFREWLNDEATFIFTSPLVRYEVLRGVNQASNPERYERLHAGLSSIENLDVRNADADLAAQLWQVAVQQNIFKPEKRGFDILHFAVAKINELEFATQNHKDASAIERAYQQIQR